jgi:hypothetical protein
MPVEPLAGITETSPIRGSWPARVWAEPLAGVHSTPPDPGGLYVDGGPASRWVCSQLVRCRVSNAVHEVAARALGLIQQQEREQLGNHLRDRLG